MVRHSRALLLAGCVVAREWWTTSAGYGLRFQENSAVAALRRGFVNFEDPGFKDIDNEVGVMFWARSAELSEDVTPKRILFHWTSTGDSNLFQPVMSGRNWTGYAFGKVTEWSVPENITLSAWNHFAISYSGGVLELFVNGISRGSSNLGIHSLRRSEVSIQIGAHTHQRISRRAQAESLKGYYGDLDELSVLSRGISQSEAMAFASGGALNVTNLGPEFVLHYNFDFEQGPDGLPFARNWGAARSDYDLMIGRMNNDFGFGLDYFEVGKGGDGDSCDSLLPFGMPYFIPGRFSNDGIIVVDMKNPSEMITFGAGFPGILTSIPEGLAVRDVAGQALLASSGFLESIVVSGNVSSFTILYVQHNSTLETVEVHLRPYVGVGLKMERLTLNLVEDSSVNFSAVSQGVFAPQDDFIVVKIEHLPLYGRLFDQETSTEILSVGYVVTGERGALCYIPFPNGSGLRYDSIRVRFLSADTLAESSLLEVNFDVDGFDDPPTVFGTSAQVKEDDPEGVSINLEAFDAEGRILLVIHSLPQNGRLYNHEGVEIATPYQIYDVGEPITMYAQEVLRVSSFWGAPPGVEYHALNILGSPSCGSASNKECDNEQASFMEGDFVMVQYDGLSRLARIRSLQINDEYDVWIHPLYLPNGDGFDVCYMVGPLFPHNCSTSPGIDKFPNLENITARVHSSAVQGVEAGVWSPLKKGYEGNQTMVGGAAATAYGPQYGFNHNQADYYPPYTEFIEVSFPKSVFFVNVEIGSPRGAGQVYGLYVKTPEGTWEPLFEDGVSQDEAKLSSRALYSRWVPQMCRPPFKSQQLRIEVDTSKETGSLDWNYIDYVKLYGSETQQSALLVRGNTQVRYVPNKNFFGSDEFHVVAYDCGGNPARASPAQAVRIEVSPVYDEVSIVCPTRLVFDMSKSLLDVDIDVNNPDGVPISLTLHKAPVLGSLEQAGQTLKNGSSFSFPGESLRFLRGACTSTDTVVESIVVSLSEGNQTTTCTVSIQVDCSVLPRRYNFFDNSSGVQAYCVFLGSVGLLFASLCSLLQWKFRRVPVIKITSPILNILICIGASLIYIFILVCSIKMDHFESCRSGEHWPSDKNYDLGESPDLTCLRYGNLCCEQVAKVKCNLRTALIAFGTVLSFGTLATKTYRVKALLISGLFVFKTTRKLTDAHLIRKITLMLVLVGCYLVAWRTVAPNRIEFRPVNSRVEGVLGYEIQVIELASTCTSDYGTFFSTIFVLAYVLLLLYGANLSWSTREIETPSANDSTPIAFSVYNIAFTGFINLLITATVTDSDVQAVSVCTITFLCTSATLAILFLPRFLDIRAGRLELRYLTNMQTVSTNSPHPSKVRPSSNVNSAKGSCAVTAANYSDPAPLEKFSTEKYMNDLNAERTPNS